MQESSPKNQTVVYLIWAVLISALIHILLVGFADRIPVALFNTAAGEPEPVPYKRPVIHIFKVPEIPENPTGDQTGLDGDATATVGEEQVRKYFEETNLITPPKPTLEVAGLGANLELPSPVPTTPVMPTAPRPDILTMDDQGLSPDELQRRFEIPEIPRSISAAPHLPSLVADGPLSEGARIPLQAGMRLSAPSSSLDNLKLPPMPPPPTTNETENLPDPDSLIPDLPDNTDPDRPEFNSMDALLNVRIFKYLPAAGDGYFRIDISPNPRSQGMRPIPKDILLLIDCSTSISPRKLKVFKQAAAFALDFLNPNDRFNVVSFRTSPSPLFETYQPITPDNLATAKTFVEKLVRGGMTDVYAGLAPFVSQSRGTIRSPLLVYLLTDGKSTVDNSLGNQEFLRKVADINRADVTIYSASTGKGANRFLLDLLAYSNRGLPLHRESYKNFDKTLAQFMGLHNDIIVADLEYDLTGTLEDQIYPRRLPHLYRGDTLSIFGRYPRRLKTIGLRLTGKSASGQLQELIYQGNLEEANRASADLSFEWIGQKVFDLVIKNVLNPRPEYAREIRRLKQKYDLQIPYF